MSLTLTVALLNRGYYPLLIVSLIAANAPAEGKRKIHDIHTLHQLGPRNQAETLNTSNHFCLELLVLFTQALQLTPKVFVHPLPVTRPNTRHTGIARGSTGIACKSLHLLA